MAHDDTQNEKYLLIHFIIVFQGIFQPWRRSNLFQMEIYSKYDSRIENKNVCSYSYGLRINLKITVDLFITRVKKQKIEQHFCLIFYELLKQKIYLLKQELYRLVMQEHDSKIKQHWYRFVIVTLYILAALVNSLPTNTFSSLNSTVSQVFDITTILVSLNSLLFPIAHTLFAVPCNWILNKKGIRFGYYISALLVSGGMWLRIFLSHQNYYICLLGSFLSAIGGIFITNTPSRLAINWFRAEMVPIVTFIGVLVNLVSMAISLSLPGILINEQSSKQDIINFLRLQAIITTVPLILLIIFIREKPEHPPSKAALVVNTKKKQHYGKLMKQIFSNYEYIKLSISMSLNFGICIALLTIMEPALVNLGYKNASQAISICGSSGIVVGLFANIIYSYTLKKSKQYKKILSLAAFGDFIGLTIWSIGYFYLIDKWWQLIIISMVFCFNHFSIPSIYILFSSQIAFPLDQASTTGYLIAVSQTVGFLVGLLFASLLDGSEGRARMVFYISVCCQFVAFIVSLSIKQDLKKTRFEQGGSLEQQNRQDIKESEKSLISIQK